MITVLFTKAVCGSEPWLNDVFCLSAYLFYALAFYFFAFVDPRDSISRVSFALERTFGMGAFSIERLSRGSCRFHGGGRGGVALN